MITTTTFYPAPGQLIARRSVTTDDDGFVIHESGSPLPDGVKPLSHDEVVALLKAHIREVKADFEAQTDLAEAQIPAMVEAQDAKRAVLVAGGLSEEAATLLVPPLRPHQRPEWTPPRTSKEWLASFGLDPGEIGSILRGA